MNIASLIISLLSGAAGGNIVGQLAKKLDLGVVGNSIAGILGGGIGSQILSQLGLGGASGGSLDIASIISEIAAGGTGGGALMAIIGVVKEAMAKK